LVTQGTIQELPEKIKGEDLVLDVGGGLNPLSRADYVLDFLPWEFGEKIEPKFRDIWPEPYFTKEKWIQHDIFSREKWPFEDKQFDFVYCSHTLEDIRDPIGVCQEIIRIGKAGYIETPSRIIESIKGIERTRYCGYYHHRWLCEINQNGIEFMFKPAQLHGYTRFHLTVGPSLSRNSNRYSWVGAFDPISNFFNIVNRWFRKINPKYSTIGMFWEGSFTFREKLLIEKKDVENDLMDFKKQSEKRFLTFGLEKNN